MRVIVSHPAQQHSYQLAKAIKQSGRLSKYCTTVYYKENALIYKMLKIVLSKDNIKRMKGRRDEELDNIVVQYNELLGLSYLFAGRFIKNRILIAKLGEIMQKRFGQNVAKCAKKSKADAVIAFDSYASACFEALDKNTTIKIIDMSSIPVFSIVDIMENELKKNSEFEESIRATLDLYSMKKIEDSKNELSMADYYLVASDFTKRKIVEGGVSPEKVFVIPYGIDLTNFKPVKRKAREKLRFLFVGRMSAAKGLEYLLKAMRKLGTERAELILVGHHQNAESYLQKYNDIIDYRGMVRHERMPEIYKEADVLVMPSLYDGFGFTVLEAMAMGMPVIASDSVGASSCIVDEVNGFVVKTADEEALYNKMLWFVENKERIRAMGEAAAEEAKIYTYENYFDKINKALDSIFEEK